MKDIQLTKPEAASIPRLNQEGAPKVPRCANPLLAPFLNALGTPFDAFDCNAQIVLCSKFNFSEIEGMPRKPRFSMRPLSTPGNIPSVSIGTNSEGGGPHSAPILTPGPSNLGNGIQHSIGEDVDNMQPTCPSPMQDAGPSQPQEPANEHQPTAAKKKNPTYWIVNVIDDQGVTRERRVRVQDVYVLPDNHRVVMEWNEIGQPIGNSGGLYGFFSGAIAADCKNFPINYKKWPLVPDYHKNIVWEKILKVKFDVSADEHRKWIMMDIGKKWKDNRARLWSMFRKSGMTFEQGVEHFPSGIPRDQWKIAEKNIANRAKQSIPHTLGTKSITRKRAEMEITLGHPISRAEMYAESHKKKDGTFTNKEDLLLAGQNDGNMTHEEAYIHVFGKEHLGRVRGMGFGVCPSQILSSSSMGSSSTATQNEIKELKKQIETLQETVANLVRSFGGRMSSNLAPNGPHQTPDLESPIGVRRSSSASYDPNNCRPTTQERQNEGLETTS
ncbi:uncharacterized protein LOC133287999 [Gastrolobium bilobum]|uniref:uncharacterized protein LOC133287999 n=1 Tax=Gastrolobium bilobum TaxID=150636 RepID=UPI002AB1BDDD|nr:uncharacterized protein LOC133287999 [Gastrolobium bilobum]